MCICRQRKEELWRDNTHNIHHPTYNAHTHTRIKHTQDNEPGQSDNDEAVPVDAGPESMAAADTHSVVDVDVCHIHAHYIYLKYWCTCIYCCIPSPALCNYTQTQSTTTSDVQAAASEPTHMIVVDDEEVCVTLIAYIYCNYRTYTVQHGCSWWWHKYNNRTNGRRDRGLQQP